MMNEISISKEFWLDPFQTIVHVLNKAHLRPKSDKTPYELWYDRPTSIKRFKVFGSRCYIKNNDEHSGKYDDKADERIFLGYATNNRGYRCFNKRMHKLMDCIDVRVDEEIPLNDYQIRSVEINDEDMNEVDEQKFK